MAMYFIHVRSRREHVAGMPPAPDAVWVAQQARNLAIYFDSQGADKPTHIVRDCDSKFTEEFCAIVENDGIEFKLISPRSPILNPIAERRIQSVKREYLDHFIVFGEAHVRYLIDSYVDYFHRFHPHQGLKKLRIGETKPPEKVDDVKPADLVCHERLSWLLKRYERKAA